MPDQPTATLILTPDGLRISIPYSLLSALLESSSPGGYVTIEPGGDGIWLSSLIDHLQQLKWLLSNQSLEAIPAGSVSTSCVSSTEEGQIDTGISSIPVNLSEVLEPCGDGWEERQYHWRNSICWM